MTTATIKKPRSMKRATTGARAAQAVIQVRVDARMKDRAEKLFKSHGLSTGDGVRLLIAQAVRAKEIPHIPNAETRKALLDENLQEISPSELTKMILGDK